MRQVKKGSTGVSVDVYIIDSTDGTPETGVVFDTSGIAMSYRRDFATVAAITEADLTSPALDDAWADGGFLAVGFGLYRLDVPDAAFATGASKVTVTGTVTGMIKTFQAITLYGTGDPKLMAGGISQALVTTVLGLSVAIPMVLLHTLVSGRSRRIVQVLQEQSAGIIASHAEKQGANARV